MGDFHQSFSVGAEFARDGQASSERYDNVFLHDLFSGNPLVS